MIGYYKFKREDIIKKIRESPKTGDGYYFCKEFNEMNTKPGDDNLDKNFYYNRELFKGKVVFSEDDIEIYMAQTKKRTIDYMEKIDKKLRETIGELICYGLFDKIPDYEFNLSELIDTTIFLWKNRLN